MNVVNIDNCFVIQAKIVLPLQSGASKADNALTLKLQVSLDGGNH